MMMARVGTRRVRESVPRSENPRDRVIDHGAPALSSAELLSIVADVSVMEATSILAKSGGSLRGIGMKPVAALADLMQSHKYSKTRLIRATSVHAALELGRRMAAEARADGAPVRSPRDVAAFYAPRLEDLPVEEFHVAILDSQHRMERDVTVTRGILNSSLVHPREVFREAIAERAAAVVLVHNHPSGDPTPSPDDRLVTEQLVSAGRLLDIPVHDHVIIGRGRYISFAEAGLL
jgi:DNA repair protein RadC